MIPPNDTTATLDTDVRTNKSSGSVMEQFGSGGTQLNRMVVRTYMMLASDLPDI